MLREWTIEDAWYASRMGRLEAASPGVTRLQLLQLGSFKFPVQGKLPRLCSLKLHAQQTGFIRCISLLHEWGGATVVDTCQWPR